MFKLHLPLLVALLQNFP